jgi:hypothetical protein
VSKRHFQATRIFAAEDSLPGAMSWSAARSLVERVCADHDVPVPEITKADGLVVNGSVGLPARPGPLTPLHAAAHILTDPMFPPHGSEFAARWLELAERYAGRYAPLLAMEFIERGVHHTSDEREEKVRRGAVYLANNRRGQVVELVLDDPPERVVGSIEGCTRDALQVGGREFPLSRARYIYKSSVV